MTRKPQFRRMLPGLCLVAAMTLGGGAFLFVAPVKAEEIAEPPRPAAGASDEAGDGAAARAEGEEQAERRRKLRLAILTGGLIAVTGLALVMLTILGGSATRRGLRRKPLRDEPPPPEPIPAERFDTPADDDLEAQVDEQERPPAADGDSR